MAVLRIHGREGRSWTKPLGRQPLTIGRAETCDIVLRNDGEVSREHAEVWCDEDGHVYVADANSKNGTRVDDGEVFRGETRPVRRIIRISEHEITISGAAPPLETPEDGVSFVADPPNRLGTTHFFPSSKGLDLNQQRLALLMSLTERIGGAFERKQLLEQALDACCEALAFERGLIVLKTPRGNPEPPVTRNVERDEHGAYKVSQTLINRALVHGERAVVNNPATDLAGNITESLVRFPICSALCVPILYRGDILGVVYGDRVTEAATYVSQDVDFLAAIAQQLGVGLANLRLFQDHVRAQRIYAELDAARKIQRDLLPAGPLRVGDLMLDGYNEPSSAVGGDYFDYFELTAHKLGFIIADVVGHGLGAALVMANLQAAVHVALSATTPLPVLAQRINELTCRNTASSVFITAVIGTVDADTGVVEYINAGHPAPILVGSHRPPPSDELNSLPLGIEPSEAFQIQRITPDQHAGVVLFYTDGLIEAVNTDGDMLGLDQVKQALADVDAPSTESALKHALQIVREHRAGARTSDDLTLLAIQLRAG